MNIKLKKGDPKQLLNSRKHNSHHRIDALMVINLEEATTQVFSPHSVFLQWSISIHRNLLRTVQSEPQGVSVMELLLRFTATCHNEEQSWLSVQLELWCLVTSAWAMVRRFRRN